MTAIYQLKINEINFILISLVILLSFLFVHSFFSIKTHVQQDALLNKVKNNLFSLKMAIKQFFSWQRQFVCTETRPECTAFQHFWSISEKACCKLPSS